MTSNMRDIVAKWSRDADSDDLLTLWERVEWLRSELFESYQPASYSRFEDRLSEWLVNFAEADTQKTMFRLLGHLFFVGREQFASLARAAFNDAITRWIIDQEAIAIDALNLDDQIEQAIAQTWFCPITDSMSINTFLKLNMTGGHSHRPDWRSLAQMGDAEKVRKFITQGKIKRLVLLEDFVGSGSQMQSTLHWASTAVPPNFPILVVPLICCPQGLRRGRELSSEIANLRFEPVLSLRPELFVGKDKQLNEPALFSEVRVIAADAAANYPTKFHEPFGFADTGALVVLHTNCPDNSLPLLHDHGKTWHALFPRISRTDAA